MVMRRHKYREAFLASLYSAWGRDHPVRKRPVKVPTTWRSRVGSMNAYRFLKVGVELRIDERIAAEIDNRPFAS